MKVLSGTASETSDDEVLDKVHSHCDTCIKVAKCTLQPVVNESCEIVTCQHNCGFRFHSCKIIEHKLLCANEKVACINANNGCPFILLRHQRAQHLATCPASIIMCTMEWNRWPIFYQERRLHIPFHVPNPRAKQGQLDIALALRDQRMLEEWTKLPRRTKRVFQNNLTPYFPALPLQRPTCDEELSHSSSSATLTDGQNSMDWTGAPSDVESSGDFSKVPQCESVGSEAGEQIHVPGTGNSLAQLMNRSELNMTDDQKVIGLKDCSTCDTENICLCECKNVCSKMITNESDVVGCSFDNLGTLRNEYQENSLEFTLKDPKFNRKESDSIFTGKPLSNDIYKTLPLDHARTICIPPPPSPPPMIVSLGLDFALESITKYDNKPKNMYTFTCAQVFRRDEYSWHYKNVHGDIHGGLNGWLEHRCPLAHYGCMYSTQRFHPTTKGASVVYNNVLESFGIRPVVLYENPILKISRKSVHNDFNNCHSQVTNNIACSTTKVDGGDLEDHYLSLQANGLLNVCHLPFEILRHVCRFLDSFSLCNLALTCRHMREVCCSLLEERGMVLQEWKKCNVGSKVTWNIAYQRWSFSTAFSPVKSWGFEDGNHMSNHLKSCAYFERNIGSKPYLALCYLKPNPTLCARLTSQLDDPV